MILRRWPFFIWFLGFFWVGEERRFADFQLIPSRGSTPSLQSIPAVAATWQFPAAGTQFIEQPFPVLSESVSSLALSKIRCHHSNHLFHFIIFLRLIKWLSISSLCFMDELL